MRTCRGLGMLLASLIVSLGLSVAAHREALARPPVEAEKGGGKYALLVGCTKYDNLPGKQLEGPANDVELVSRLLRDKYKFPPETIVTLSEAEAKSGGDMKRPTRENIRREFAALADPKRVKKGSQVVIFLCGHGSQEPLTAPLEEGRFKPDGKQEVFLPADVELWDVEKQILKGAIADREFRAWLKSIREKTQASVWVIVDACHSATIIRGTDQDKAREVSPEELKIPRAAFDKARGAAKEATRGHPEKVRGEGDQVPFPLPADDPDVVAVYAAQAYEPTYERPLPDDSTDAKPHGLLTYALCEVLFQAKTPLTYADLIQRIHAQYSGWGRTYPTPLLEGKFRNREVLGDKELYRGRWFRLLADEKAGGWKVDAGALHGLTPGSVLAVHSEAGAEGADKPVGYVRVTKDLSPLEAKVVPHAYQKAPPLELEKLPKSGGRCRVAFIDYGDLRLKVAADKTTHQGQNVPEDREKTLREELTRLAEDKGSVIKVGSAADAAWLLRYDSLESGKLYLVPGSGWSLAAGQTRSGADQLAALPRTLGPVPEGEARSRWLKDALEKIARVQNLLHLVGQGGGDRAQNDRTEDELDVRVKVEVLKLKDKDDPNGAPVEWGTGVTFSAGDWIGFRVNNEGREAADVNLLFIDSKYGITPIFPKAATTDNRLSRKDKPLRFRAKVSGESVGLEHLVVIAIKAKPNDEYANFVFLKSASIEGARGVGGENSRGFGSPLGALLRNALYADGRQKGLDMDDPASTNFACNVYSWQVKP